MKTQGPQERFLAGANRPCSKQIGLFAPFFLAVCLAAPILLALSNGRTWAEEPLYLVYEGQTRCTIVRGQDDDFAAERLQRHLADACRAKVNVVLADAWQEPGKGACVFVGSAKSNRWIEKIAADNNISLDPAQLTGQGYVAKRLSHQGNDCVVLAGGGRDGAIYAVVDLIHWNLETNGNSAWIKALDTRQIPRLRYRWLWAWDSRLDWGAPGKASTAVGGPYLKPADSFLDDGKRCIDFMADHKFNGLILWGFLRDAHGGVAASQELCRYANRRGVRILPGVGTNCAYGGYYYEGKHPFNMKTWLDEHPELRALDKDGKPRDERDNEGRSLDSACPSKPANQQWLDRGAKWLFENFRDRRRQSGDGRFLRLPLRPDASKPGRPSPRMSPTTTRTWRSRTASRCRRCGDWRRRPG